MFSVLFLIQERVLTSSDIDMNSETIEIESDVTKIDDQCFYGSDIKNFTFQADSQLKVIGKSAFSSCHNLQFINLSQCRYLENISDEAFQYSPSVEYIILPHGLKEIGNHAFEGLGEIFNVDLPSTVTKIGEYAFYQCHKLTYFNILRDSQLDTMEESIFLLTNVSELFLPKSLKTIQQQIPIKFELEDGNKNYTEENGILFNKNDKYYYFWNKNKPINSHLKLKDGYEKVLAYCFQNCTYLESVEIPDSITDIGHFAFASCLNLVNITFRQNSSIILGYNSFAHCISIKNITIPSINYFDSTSFYGNEALEYVNISIDGDYNSFENPFMECYKIKHFVDMESEYFLIINNTIYFKNFNAKPDVLKYAPQTNQTEIEIDCNRIDIGAFACSENLQKVFLKNVVSIEIWAFMNCTNLLEIHIPDTIQQIEPLSFENCDKLCIIVENNNQTTIDRLISNNIPKILFDCENDFDNIRNDVDETYDFDVYRSALYMIVAASASLYNSHLA